MDEILINLQEKGYRITKSRFNLIEIFYKNQDEHFTFDEISLAVRKKEQKVNKMSIYNNIKILLREDIIKESVFNGKKIYEYNEVNHTHFYCKSCGQQIDLTYDDLFVYNEKIEKKYDIKIDSTKVEFYGFCNECKE